MMRKIAAGRRVCGPVVCRLGIAGLGIASVGIAGPLGCAGNQPQAMDSSRFLPPVVSAARPDSMDSASAMVASEDLKPAESASVVAEQPKNASILPDPAVPTTRPFPAIEPIGEIGSPPATEPSQAVSAAPAVVSPSASQTMIAPTPTVTANPTDIRGKGVYITLGGVLAQVNDTPIYANAVLAPLKKELTAKAREMAPDDFRDFAAHEIMQQLSERIDDERYFATAYHALSQDDKNLAEAHAMMDRHDRIIAAGGSVEQARKLSAEQGVDFDQQVLKDYREIVFELYRHREIEPLIQVNADDMRDFYRHNVGKLYSTKSEALFRVIEIDKPRGSAISGPRGQTTQPVHTDIATVRERAVQGEDFAALASSVNDDAYLRDRAGCPLGEGKWIERGSYVLDALEAEIWKLQPGQITPVVEINGKQYIAKLEARHDGSVKAFEDTVVQADMYRQLRQMQFNRLWQERKDESATEAMISPPDPGRFEVALEMAMQNYAQQQQVVAGH